MSDSNATRTRRDADFNAIYSVLHQRARNSAITPLFSGGDSPREPKLPIALIFIFSVLAHAGKLSEMNRIRRIAERVRPRDLLNNAGWSPRMAVSSVLQLGIESYASARRNTSIVIAQDYRITSRRTKLQSTPRNIEHREPAFLRHETSSPFSSCFFFFKSRLSLECFAPLATGYFTTLLRRARYPISRTRKTSRNFTI